VKSFGRAGAEYPCVKARSAVLALIILTATPATHVRFLFAYDDAAGKTLGDGVLDRRGTFSTGATIEGPASLIDSQHEVRCCRHRDRRALVRVWRAVASVAARPHRSGHGVAGRSFCYNHDRRPRADGIDGFDRPLSRLLIDLPEGALKRTRTKLRSEV
jgi:hypothetical protein